MVGPSCGGPQTPKKRLGRKTKLLGETKPNIFCWKGIHKLVVLFLKYDHDKGMEIPWNRLRMVEVWSQTKQANPGSKTAGCSWLIARINPKKMKNNRQLKKSRVCQVQNCLSRTFIKSLEPKKTNKHDEGPFKLYSLYFLYLPNPPGGPKNPHGHQVRRQLWRLQGPGRIIQKSLPPERQSWLSW